MINDSTRIRLRVTAMLAGLEVRSSEVRHSADESDCPACRARVAQWTKPRTGNAWLEYASAGLAEHNNREN